MVINEFVGLNTHFGITALGWWEGIEKVNNACIILVALSDGTILICDIHPDEPSQKINIVYSYVSNINIYN